MTDMNALTRPPLSYLQNSAQRSKYPAFILRNESRLLVEHICPDMALEMIS